VSRNPNARIIPYTGSARKVAGALDEFVNERLRNRMIDVDGAVHIDIRQVSEFMDRLRPMLRRRDAGDVVAVASWSIPVSCSGSPIRTAHLGLSYVDAASQPYWWDSKSDRMLRMEVDLGVGRGGGFSCDVYVA